MFTVDDSQHNAMALAKQDRGGATDRGLTVRLWSRGGSPAAQVAGLYGRPGKVVVADLGRFDHGIWHVRCTGTVATGTSGPR